MKNKNKRIGPSFFQLIKWGSLAVLFMYLSTLANRFNFKVISILNIICSLWCAFVAIAEAYLIHMGQGAIDKAVNDLDKE